MTVVVIVINTDSHHLYEVILNLKPSQGTGFDLFDFASQPSTQVEIIVPLAGARV